MAVQPGGITGASQGTAGVRVVHVVVLTGLALALIPLFPFPVTAEGPSQGAYAHNVPAPVVDLQGSHDGGHAVVVDEDARYTALLDHGERERHWIAPPRGYLGLVEEDLGEVDPEPVAVTMTPNGEHWAGAVSYSGNFGGRVHGFAHWSDEPIWTFELADGDLETDPVQPTALASGGSYHAVGTTNGKVHVLLAGGEDGTNKKAHRTYKQGNDGVPFGPITDVAVSRNGKLFLIGTEPDGQPSLHLYTDIFFKTTFKRIKDPIQLVALSGDGTRGAAVTGTGDSARVHFLDIVQGTTIWEHTVGSDVESLSLSHGGTLLAVGLASGHVHLFEEQGGILDSEPRLSHSFDATATSVSAADDGHSAVATTEDGRVHLLDLRRDHPLWSYEVPAPTVAAVLSGDQEMLVVGSVSGEEGRVTYLEAVHDLEHMVPPQPRLLPGTTQSIPVELANNGNRMTTVEVVWKAAPNQWETAPTNITLAPGESGTLGADLTLPPGQPEGDFELRFDLVTNALSIPVTVQTRVPEVTSGQSVQVWSFERAVPGGGPAAFLMRLLNTGNTMNELALGYSGLPSGWEAEFTGPRETKLRPGEDRQVALTVRAPADAQIGDEAWFDLVIAWQHGEERHPLRVEVVDHETYTYELEKITGNGSVPEEEGLDNLIEQMSHDAARGVGPNGGEGDHSVLIPAGGPSVPVGALTAAVLILLVVRHGARRRNHSGR